MPFVISSSSAISSSSRWHRYAPRRSRVRLGFLVVGLVLVIVLMQSLRSPQAARKFEQLFGNPTAAGRAGEEGGSLVAVTAEKLATSNLVGPVHLPPIDPALLATIEDHQPFRSAESAAWFHLLQLARDLPKTNLAHQAIGEVSYAQLVEQPDVYRGHLLQLRGHARRIEQVAPGENRHGIKSLYRVVVEPLGGGPIPYLLYCLQLPPGWGVGVPPEGMITAVPFFFKNKVYGHAAGIDVSPVLVAKTFHPLQRVVSSPRTQSLLAWWQLLLLAIILTVALVGGIFAWGGQKTGKNSTCSGDVLAALGELELKEKLTKRHEEEHNSISVPSSSSPKEGTV